MNRTTRRRVAATLGLSIGMAVGAVVASPAPAHAAYPVEPGTNTHYVRYQTVGCYQWVPGRGWLLICV